MWKKAIVPSIRMLLVLTVITGVLYPLVVLGIGQVIFPAQANGSLLQRDGVTVGSSLIGQANSDERYFWTRPSAVNYMDGSTAAALGSSGASNLGPTSATLAQQVTERDAAFRKANAVGADAAVPADMVTASGSGLDPHISPAAALAQANRVAAARGLDPAKVVVLLQQHTEPRQLGVLGEPRVNVLELNLALDQLQ